MDVRTLDVDAPAEPAGLSLDPEAAVRSVERIRVLHPNLLLPGHGAPARLPHIPTTDA